MNAKISSAHYSLPPHNRILRPILRPFFRMLFHILSKVEIEGKENIPRKGAYLIAINHVSLFDPPFVMAFWPTAVEAAGASDIWERKGQSLIIRLYGAIPVHRGQYDRSLIDRMVAALRSGHPILIAPEGGRTHSPGLRKGLPGVAQVADMAKVPVVPVGVVGATDDFFKKGISGKRPLIRMRIGKPIKLPALQGKGAERRKYRQDNVDMIMRKIAELLPSDYQGVYTQEIFKISHKSDQYEKTS